MPTAPSLNGQVIGQAQHAVQAVLDRLLARTGTTFHQWVALNLAATAGRAVDGSGGRAVDGSVGRAVDGSVGRAADGSVGRAELIGRMRDGLKIADQTAASAVDALTAAGLLAPVPGEQRLRLTATGEQRYGGIRAGIDAITERLYGDLPADDLATAGRVLAAVTARANAELAA
jgi:hypothetical protein